MMDLQQVLESYAAESGAELTEKDGVLHLNIYAGKAGNTP